QALFINRVLEPRMRPIQAITIITLDAHHRIDCLQQLVRRDEPDDVREPRIGLRHLVRAAHTAADRHIESVEPPRRSDGDESEILCKYIDIVDRRKHKSNLELAW